MIVKLFYSIESWGGKYLSHNFQTALWYLLKYSLNWFLPIYYKISKIREGKNTKNYINGEVIISLTTFPARMKSLPLVLETIYRQTVKADRVILWLADSQYPDKEIVDQKLEKFIRMGLGIRYCDDLRSHKKYFYCIKENPDAYIVTVDDDILCPEDMLERLLTTHQDYPDCIVTQRAHKMVHNVNGQLEKYGKWKLLAKGYKGPDMYLCQTGGAGCLYPPYSLDERAFDVDNVKRLCPMADDLWLKAMSYLKGTKVVLTGINNPEIIDVIGNKSNGLAKENVENNLNDDQLSQLTQYYQINWSKYL